MLISGTPALNAREASYRGCVEAAAAANPVNIYDRYRYAEIDVVELSPAKLASLSQLRSEVGKCDHWP